VVLEGSGGAALACGIGHVDVITIGFCFQKVEPLDATPHVMAVDLVTWDLGLKVESIRSSPNLQQHQKVMLATAKTTMLNVLV